MNILFFADNFPPEKNAQASRVYERACHWIRWGHRVTVITGAPNFPEGKVYEGYKNRWYQVEDMSGIRVVRVKTFIAPNSAKLRRILDFLSYMASSFVAGLFQQRHDVVVATSPQFFAAVAGWALAVSKRKPFILEISDLWPDSIVAVGAMKRGVLLRLLERVELFLYREAAGIVALTNAFKKNMVARGVPATKIAVVTNGVEIGKFRPLPKDLDLAAEWGITPDDFVISYIGTLGMAHGLDNLLACAEVVKGSRIRFLLVGPGAEREALMAEATRRNLQNVTFVPPQPKERMPSFWSISDIALVHLKNTPLFTTVIPSKMFEAMGMGLPMLLVAPAGEASQIVLNENVGLWIAPGDPTELARAVEGLEADPELCRRLARNSLAAALNHTRERQAEEMLACINTALKPQVDSADCAVDGSFQ